MSHLIHSLISLIIALFFLLIGVVGILIPWSVDVRHVLAQFIFEDSLAISLFGFAFFIVGVAIAINILLGLRKRYYRISSKDSSTTVEEGVIEEYVTSYWQKVFPEHEIPYQLSLKNNKIHIIVDFPYLPIQEQRPLLERIRKDLCHIFAKVLGYQDEFFLSASFQPKNGS